ncbi:peroxiredoxin-like family protein [uncultured Clostridium sp.]|uniref:peroxiredoxin-like family protein n=1 Tax=uncultured Clostridium sp. TaxID=59620 RepID=UPI002619C5FB|nr:peroxiredoxin-like family protein [uncultured Clostridium sp.]
MSFVEELNNLKENAKVRLPKDIYESYEKAIKDLEKENIEKIALNKGDLAPNFTLKNHLGKIIELDELLKSGPVIINFYRGGWCPYCNLELRAYERVLDEINNLGGVFIAISPETPDNSISTKEKNELRFDVLSDLNNEVAKEFKIVFKVPNNIAKIYEERGMNLSKSQSNELNELPLPAIYIIDKNRKIQFAFVKADYKDRLDPSIVLEELKKLRR